MDSVRSKTSTEALVINRVLKAPRERVFQAWTEAEQIKQWFGPECVTTNDVTVDLKIGGAYRIEMTDEDGEKIVQRGVYREITPPEQLIFTWVLEGQHCLQGEEGVRETLVTVTFEEKDGETVLHLVHEGLPNEKTKAGHEYGWNGCLDSLAKTL